LEQLPGVPTKKGVPTASNKKGSVPTESRCASPIIYIIYYHYIIYYIGQRKWFLLERRTVGTRFRRRFFIFLFLYFSNKGVTGGKIMINGLMVSD
jgi:hypothetical protein